MDKAKKMSKRYFASDSETTSEQVEVITPSLPTKTQIEEDIEPLRKQKSSSVKTDKVEGKSVSESITHDLSNMSVIKFMKKKKYRDMAREKTKKKRLRDQDPFPGDAPIPEERLEKYRRIDQSEVVMKTKFHTKRHRKETEKYQQAIKQAARTELLNQEEAGYLEADDGEETTDISQHQIADAVDISSAQKFFELTLDKFGPYRMNYTRNGRQLLIGGGKGHVAAFDWQTKKLMCETNVMETIHDVKWLHQETMFAVAQKRWTYIYDNQGIELHCLKLLDSVLRMEFLPYHFLLCTASAKSYIAYLDVSVGKKVAGFPTGLGRLNVMCQNPSNAIIHLGHSGGTVTLWSPNIKEPLVKMLCHGVGTRAITVDATGRYMATSGVDRKIKVWDLRTYRALHTCKVGAGPGSLSFSQKGCLAAGIGNIVEVYRDCRTEPIRSAYLRHQLPGTVAGLQFCPYEDVLGVSHGKGFSSLLIPGAGEPNFDALEVNPYQSKSQRRHAEVNMLLEKIQPDMISLDSGVLGKVDHKTIQETMEAKVKSMHLKPQTIEFEPKNKKKGKSKTGKLEKRKQGVKFENKQEQIRDFVHKKKLEEKSKKVEEKEEPYNIFGRFKKKAV